MSDCFGTDLLSLLFIFIEMYCLSEYTGLKYHQGWTKIFFYGLFYTGKKSSIEIYLDKRNTPNSMTKDEIKKTREIYRHVIFKYVFGPRCILGALFLIIEFPILIFCSDAIDTMSGEFIATSADFYLV